MANTVLLSQKIKESGYRIRFVASRLGLTYAGFLKKMKGETDFRVGEAYELSQLLGIDDELMGKIFFTPFVDRQETRPSVDGGGGDGVGERLAVGETPA